MFGQEIDDCLHDMHAILLKDMIEVIESMFDLLLRKNYAKSAKIIHCTVHRVVLKLYERPFML